MEGLNEFKETSDIIVSNRLDAELQDEMREGVYKGFI